MFRCLCCLLTFGSALPAFAILVSPTAPESLRPGPLHAVIEQLYGQPVIPYDGQCREEIEAAAREAFALINRHGLSARRVNEIGNAVEPLVIAALQAQGFSAGIPATASGRRQSSGYPDIEAQLNNTHFYFEIKTYNPANEATTQRSFYLSPSTDPKVTAPACHLIMAFAMEQATDGTYRAHAVRVLDIAGLSLGLKFEFNASNRDLYAPEHELFRAP